MTTGPHTLTEHAVEGMAVLRAVIATKEHTQQLLLASATLHRAHAPAASVSCPSVPHLVLGAVRKGSPQLILHRSHHHRHCCWDHGAVLVPFGGDSSLR